MSLSIKNSRRSRHSSIGLVAALSVSLCFSLSLFHSPTLVKAEDDEMEDEEEDDNEDYLDREARYTYDFTEEEYNKVDKNIYGDYGNSADLVFDEEEFLQEVPIKDIELLRFLHEKFYNSAYMKQQYADENIETENNIYFSGELMIDQSPADCQREYKKCWKVMEPYYEANLKALVADVENEELYKDYCSNHYAYFECLDTESYYNNCGDFVASAELES